jgi:hypothetical protein
MVRLPVGLMLTAALAGCAAIAPLPGTASQQSRFPVTYSCSKVQSLRVKLEATSASVTIDGDGPYTLPQTTGRADLTVYSDGQRTLQLSRNEVQFGQGRGQLQLCTGG